jgi:ADP-ribosylglycohydrolase
VDRQGRRDRALGALYGLAVGDALGMPTQLLPRAEVARRFGVLSWFEPGPADHPIAAGLPAGRVTDDTDQALIVARLLVEGGGHVDAEALAARLREWQERMRAAGSLDLLGPSTTRALEALARGVPAAEAGRHGDTNGAAMRIAAVGIAVPPEPLGRLLDRVEEASRLTHHTSTGIAGAAAVAAAVSAGLDGADAADALRLAAHAAQECGGRGADPDPPGTGAGLVANRISVALHLAAGAFTEAEGLGHLHERIGTGVATAESVPTALGLVRLCPGDPWRATLLAAGLGGDSDTVAAMAGAVSGALNGLGAFPRPAVAVVRQVNDLDLGPLADDLLALRDTA